MPSGPNTLAMRPPMGALRTRAAAGLPSESDVLACVTAMRRFWIPAICILIRQTKRAAVQHHRGRWDTHTGQYRFKNTRGSRDTPATDERSSEYCTVPVGGFAFVREVHVSVSCDMNSPEF
jgi:hypothetical protein